MSLYISSGNGVAGPYDPPSGIPGVSSNYAGMGLEILSRLTSQTFATKLNKLGIPAQVNYRPSGLHTLEYWQFELKQLWAQAAEQTAELAALEERGHPQPHLSLRGARGGTGYEAAGLLTGGF